MEGFLSSPYAGVVIESCQFDQNVCSSIKYLVISHKRVPSDISFGIWENRVIVLKPEQEMAIYNLLHERDVKAILSTGFGKSRSLLSLLWPKKKCPH